VPDHHRPAVRQQPLPHAGEQAGLAQPGLAGDQAETAGAAGARGQLAQPVQFRGPADEQRVQHRRGGRCRFGRCRQRVDPLVQDRVLELDQRGSRIQAELVGQRPAGPAQGGQRVRLPAGRPQRLGQQAPALLTQRVFPGQHLCVRDGAHRPAQPDRQLDRQLAGHHPQLGEPGRLGGGPLFVGHLGVRRAMPQPEPLGDQVERLLRSFAGGALRPQQQILEAPGVHRAGRQPQRVPRGAADQERGRAALRPVRFQQLAQIGDVRLQRRDRPRWWLAPPQQLDHPVHRDHLATADQQQGQHGTLSRAARVHRAAGHLELDRAEHPDTHHGDDSIELQADAKCATKLLTDRTRHD
jgi:hypothetical protein